MVVVRSSQLRVVDLSPTFVHDPKGRDRLNSGFSANRLRNSLVDGTERGDLRPSLSSIDMIIARSVVKLVWGPEHLETHPIAIE